MNFSIVIFMFNEAGNIRKVYSDAVAQLQHMNANYEIILVNDGSTDDTGKICQQLRAEFPYTSIITHPKNLGIGAALTAGYHAAKNEYVCATTGDGQFNIKELGNTKPFNNSTYYSFYRLKTNYSFYRSCLTWINRLFNQHLLGIYLRDVNWIKVYRKEQLLAVKTKLNSSLIESEICAKLYKMNIMPIEIPSEYLPRTYGIAKGGSWKTLRKAMIETSKLWWEVHKFTVEK